MIEHVYDESLHSSFTSGEDSDLRFDVIDTQLRQRSMPGSSVSSADQDNMTPNEIVSRGTSLAGSTGLSLGSASNMALDEMDRDNDGMSRDDLSINSFDFGNELGRGGSLTPTDLKRDDPPRSIPENRQSTLKNPVERYRNRHSLPSKGIELAAQAVRMLEIKRWHSFDPSPPRDSIEAADNTHQTANLSKDSTDEHISRTVHVAHRIKEPLSRLGGPFKPDRHLTKNDEKGISMEVGRNLSAYLPRSVLAEIATKRLCSKAYGNDNSIDYGAAAPRRWPTRAGGILMVDVSGFTKLTIKFSKDAEEDRHQDAMKEVKRPISKTSEGVFKQKNVANDMHTAKRGSSTSLPESLSVKSESQFSSTAHAIRRPTPKVRENRMSPAEKMSVILNDYFGKMIRCIERLGGDVIKFAGDALLVYFPANVEFDVGSFGTATSWASLQSVLLRMARCSLELLRDCSDYVVPFPGQRQQLKLNVHVMCSVMPTTGMHVGGLSDRIEFVMTGDNFPIIGDLLNHANSGEITFDKDMWEALQDIEGNCGDEELFEVLKLTNVEPIHDPSISSQVIGYRLLNAKTVLSETSLFVPLPSLTSPLQFTPTLSVVAAGSDPFIRSYVPHNVLHYHDSGQSSLLCENRIISAVFCSLPPTLCSTFESTQTVVHKIQRILRKHNGLLRQFMVDDKGTVAIAVWGCPPLANMDDAARAVKAAIDLKTEFNGDDCHLGVATGMCYCGTIGTDSRCEYVVIGEAVNFAARLMGFSIKMSPEWAKPENGKFSVVCDENTATTLSSSRRTRASIEVMDEFEYSKFEVMRTGTNEFKGCGIQNWYEVRELKTVDTREHDAGHAENGVRTGQSGINEDMTRERFSRIIGREVEIKIINGALFRSLGVGVDGRPLLDRPSSCPPYILCVHGPMGVGKSMLNSYLRSQVNRIRDINSRKELCSASDPNSDASIRQPVLLEEITVVEVDCDDQEKNTSWHAVRALLPLLWQTVAMLTSSVPSLFLTEDIDYFDDKPSWWRSIALLADISGSDGIDCITDNCLDLVQLSEEFTQTLSGETRLLNLLDLLLHIISLAIGHKSVHSDEERLLDQDITSYKRVLLLVDDIQACDSNSMKFFSRYIDLCEREPGKAMIHMSMRPGGTKEVKNMKDRAKQTIRLQHLEKTAISKLVLAYSCITPNAGESIDTKTTNSTAHINMSNINGHEILKEAMPAPSCEETLLNFVEKSSAGLPLFVAEACRYLRRKELVTYDKINNVLHFNEDGMRLLASSENESETPQEVTQKSVRVLIDDLSPEARLLLKCSTLMPQYFRLFDVVTLAQAMSLDSVLGNEVKQGACLGESAKKTKIALEEIVANRLWEKSGPSQRFFRFSHSFMSETVYNSMTGGQRELLHSLLFFIIEGAISEKVDRERISTEEVKRGRANYRPIDKKSGHKWCRSSGSHHRRTASPHSFASATIEWRARNAALAGIHNRAASLYFLSAQEQYRSLSYAAADVSMSEVQKHLDELDSQSIHIKKNESIPTCDRVGMMKLRGLLCCLLDRPLEGRPLLEKALIIGGEDIVSQDASIIACVVAEETTLQHVHRIFTLEGAPHIGVLDLTKNEDCDEEGVVVTELERNATYTVIAKECAAACDQLARVYLQTGEPMRGILACLRGLNLSEMVGQCEELAKAYATYAFVKKSPFYGSRAREVSVTVGKFAPVTGFCAMLYGGMLIGEGDFLESKRMLEQAVKISTATKDYSTLGLSLSVLGWSLYVGGKFVESLGPSKEMQRIGEQQNDVRFKNWGLTSIFRSTLALGDMDAANEILPEIQSYIHEFENSMYNSDKIGVAGMMITMRLLENDIEAVRENMEYWKDVIELVTTPCTQLVEFAGCVGIIEGMIATLHDDPEKNLPRLDLALNAFDEYSSAYPVLRCRANYLKGQAHLAKIQISGEHDTKDCIEYFRVAVAWARRFNITHEEELTRKLNNPDLVDWVFAEPIKVMNFNRDDSALDGVDCMEVRKDFRKMLVEIEEKDEWEAWMNEAEAVSSKLEAVWGRCNSSLLCATTHVRSNLIMAKATSAGPLENGDERLGKAIDLASKEELTILSLCMASYRTKKAKEVVANDR